MTNVVNSCNYIIDVADADQRIIKLFAVSRCSAEKHNEFKAR